MTNSSEHFRILCLGDVVGRPGRSALKQRLRALRLATRADMVIVNAENASGGVGIDPESAREIGDAGADILTLGDHTWQRREAAEWLSHNEDFCIRPANYPAGAPGAGAVVWTADDGFRVGVMNLLGRIFINFPLDCPFRKADEILAGPLADCDAVILDMHAEATSEKMAIARYLRGRVALVYGTHTHVQTADHAILGEGTAFMSDLGMCGPTESVIGMDPDVALKRFLTGMPHAYKIGRGPVVISGCVVTIARASGHAVAIEPVREMIDLSAGAAVS
jgi:2',3'-cyclic-nucleotide 2'-phosphodiesterase